MLTELLTRRLRGLAMISRGIVPNLLVAQRVIDQITDAASQHLEDETGETLVGLLMTEGDQPDDPPALIVLDTIAPDDTVIRQSHMFEQGDDLQGDSFVWLYENWQLRRARDGQSRFDVPLRHLGDWHKQPGFMIQPSGGDLMTALHFMDDPEHDMDSLLVPIVTLGHPDTTHEREGAQVNYLTVTMPDGSCLRIDWWYIHRDVRMFQPLTPVIMPDDALPELTPYPWHIVSPQRLRAELTALEARGLLILGQTALLWDADGAPPLEIGLMLVGQRLRDQVLLITTAWDYPQTPPRARMAPFQQFALDADPYTIFAQLWAHSEAVEQPPGFDWSAVQGTLFEYVDAVISHLGFDDPEQPSDTEASQDRSS